LEIPLWRYMDLSKFAALLQKRTLHFARADNLGDPLEGSVPKPSSTWGLRSSGTEKLCRPKTDVCGFD
ncbi:MAG: hypothetical protein ACRYG8_46410, partial [Janthinobacterium lividum]